MSALRGMTWDHPRGKAPLVALGDRSGSTGSATVSWDARSLQAFADEPLDALAARYDLLVIDHPHIPLVADAGLLVALDESPHAGELATLSSESVGSSFSSYVHAGHVYALPIDAAAQVAAQRPDLLGEVPGSWDEVLELAAAGRVLWPTKPVDAMSSFLTLCSQAGEEVCSGAAHFVSPETGLGVLDLMHRLAALVPAACRDQNPIEVAEWLVGDDGYAYAPLLFGYVNYSRVGFRPHRLAYRDIPAGARGVAGSCLGGAGIAVSANSRDLATALDVAFWLASAPVQRGEYYREGGQPGNARAWEDPEVNADCLEFFRGTRRTLEGASVRPRHAGWLELQDRCGELVHATIAGALSDEECLERLDAERVRLLDEPSTSGAR